MDGQARLLAYLATWARTAADGLRQSGYVGTDGELAAASVALTGVAALAEHFRRDPAFPADAAPALLAADNARDLVATALDCAAATGTAVLAALEAACGVPAPVAAAPSAAAACVLCDPDLRPLIAEDPLWRVVLNRNQNLLGKCMIVCRRHVEPVVDLSTEEWADLRVQMRRVTAALTARFAPDHFNYAFLQNQDRHVHVHVLPRYAGPRTFAGTGFEDPDWPHGVGGRALHLPPEQLARIAAALAEAGG